MRGRKVWATATATTPHPWPRETRARNGRGKGLKNQPKGLQLCPALVGPASAERALCEHIRFLFCELSDDSFSHFLINTLGSLPLCVKVKVTDSLESQWTVAFQAPLSMEFSRQEYWVGFHSLLQGIFLTQESNPGLLHCRQILYHLRHQGSPCPCAYRVVFSFPGFWFCGLESQGPGWLPLGGTVMIEKGE